MEKALGTQKLLAANKANVDALIVNVGKSAEASGERTLPHDKDNGRSQKERAEPVQQTFRVCKQADFSIAAQTNAGIEQIARSVWRSGCRDQWPAWLRLRK